LRRFFLSFTVTLSVNDGKLDERASLELENAAASFGDDTQGVEASQPDLSLIHKYQALISLVVQRKSKVIDVRVDDVALWIGRELENGSLANAGPEDRIQARSLPSKIEGNTMRYVALMEEVLDQLVREETLRLGLRPSLASQRYRSGTFGMSDEAANAIDSSQAHDENGEGARERSIVRAKLDRQ
jgi:hypothetical protein